MGRDGRRGRGRHGSTWLNYYVIGYVFVVGIIIHCFVFWFEIFFALPFHILNNKNWIFFFFLGVTNRYHE